MKILALHFKNVNSLAGEWNIRFDDPAFLRSHLFAISGPTGSGKTSVLDAIALALYGKTPRQENVAEKRGVDVGAELVMTSGTGESFSEVEFESSGKRYLSIWKVHRSRNSPTGQVQQAERKLLFEENGVFVAHDDVSKTLEVQKKVEEVVGLNFEQFMRAVMLPQGGFDSFLKSKREEKAAILEKLSGQEVYRKISKEVYARNKKESERLRQLLEQLAGIKLLPENEERDLASWLETAKKTKQLKTNELKKCEEFEHTLLDIERVEKTCQDLRKTVESLATENRQLDVDRKRLARGSDAQQLVAPLETLEHLRKDFTAKNLQKKELQKKVPEKEQECRVAQMELEARTSEENNLRLVDKNRNVLRDQVSALDSEIRRHKQACAEKQEQIKIVNVRIEKFRQEVAEQKTKLAEVEKNLVDCHNYEHANPTHKMLESEQAVISDRLSHLDDAKTFAEKAKDALVTAKVRVAEAEDSRRKKELELSCIADERDRSFANDINKIAVLIQTSLQDGDVCPVCGSPFHATHADKEYAKGDISATANRLSNLQKRYENAQSEVNTALFEVKRTVDVVAACEKDLLDKNAAVKECFNTVVQKLKPYGFTEVDLNAPQIVLSKIQKWAQNWNACMKKIDDDNRLLNLINVKMGNLQESIENSQKDLHVFEVDLTKCKIDLQNSTAERHKLFGSRDVAEDRREVQEKIDAATQKRIELTNRFSQTSKDLAAIKSQLKTIAEQLSAEEREIVRLETELLTKIREHGFGSEDDLRNALLSESLHLQLSQKIEQVSADYANKSGQLQQAEKQLAELRSRETGHETLLTVQSKMEDLRKVLLCLENDILEKNNRFIENSVAKKTSAKTLVQKEEQDRIVHVWSTLNDLIGSADGKRFVEYVQQLTLRKLIAAANKHLHSLNPRFKIETDETGLNISLYDAECGTTRSAVNLSGGETFLVSLSLALGLSSLASQRVRIDTLFLDEGFGSLDERRLQKAIEVLRNLGERGDKLVGVISHVNRVKEEISNHIEVVPTGSGHSRIEGPGVSN